MYRKLRLWIGAILIILLLFCLSIPLLNDLTAWRVKRELERCPLPAGATLCASLSQAGKLTGCGNGMQYFGAILLRSDQSLEALDAYYAARRQDPWSFIVEKQTGLRVRAAEYMDLSFAAALDDTAAYYIVYSWGSVDNGLLVYFDLRGH